MSLIKTSGVSSERSLLSAGRFCGSFFYNFLNEKGESQSIPTGDYAVESLADNGIVGGFDNCRQPVLSDFRFFQLGFPVLYYWIGRRVFH